MKIVNDKNFKYSLWMFDNNEVRFVYEKQGAAAYSKKYDAVVVMKYQDDGGLDLKVLEPNGNMVSTITPSEEDLSYQYLVKHPSSTSGIAVVGSYKTLVNNFQEWHFEIDLNNFLIGKRLGPSY